MEESPSTNGLERLLTAGRGDPTESATESEPLALLYVMFARANRCGKSAPRRR